jgi:flagellar basal body P-ring formation protein FlgA
MDAPDGGKVPAGDVAFSARALPAGTAPSRHMTVWVDARVDGRFVRAVPVQFKVAALVPAWVARDEIPAGARVSAAAFVPGEADLAVAPGEQPRRRAETFANPGDTLLVRHALRPGQPLTAANSGPVPLVARGESALLRMKSSLIELESRVDVLQDGYLGQTVRVRAGKAGGIVVARVAGAGLLETQN